MKPATFILIIVIVALAIAGTAFAMHAANPAFNLTALLIGDLVMALLTLFSFFMIARQLSGTHAFTRGVSGSSLLKLMVCAVGIVAYALITKPHTHRPTLFSLMGIYVVYTAVETAVLSAIARKKQ